jgi:hypothetical protein
MRHLPAILLLLAGALAALRAETVLINPALAGETLDGERVRDMLLGRITTWNDGTAVTIVLVDDRATDTRLEALVGRDRQRLLRGWKRLVYSGSGVMPHEVPSLAEAVALIARTPGALALVIDAPEDPRVRRVAFGK